MPDNGRRIPRLGRTRRLPDDVASRRRRRLQRQIEHAARQAADAAARLTALEAELAMLEARTT